MGMLGNVCRLCGEKLDPVAGISIFRPDNSRVLSMILQCMPITVQENDPYPKSVCGMCVATLDAVHELREKSLSVSHVFSATLSADDGNGCEINGNLLHIKEEQSYDIEFKQEQHNDDFNDLEFTETETENRPLLICEEEEKINSNVTKSKHQLADKKTYECQYCEKKYLNKSNLTEHLLIHTSVKSLQCTDCGKSFHHKKSLISHKKSHSGKELCQFCHKSYFDKSTLKKHMRLHTGEKPYQCLHCGKRFAVRAIMLIHQRTHEDEKNYECDVCKRRFSEKSYLRKHQTIHTGEKPFRCEHCGKNYRVKASLGYHIRRFHTTFKILECEIEPEPKGKKLNCN